MILVIVAGAWSAGARSAAAAPRPAAPAPAKPVAETNLTADDRGATEHESESTEPIQPRLDLYGNEIEPAVTDYRVDFYGDVYERHSPDTALLELTAPSI